MTRKSQESKILKGNKRNNVTGLHAAFYCSSFSSTFVTLTRQNRKQRGCKIIIRCLAQHCFNVMCGLY